MNDNLLCMMQILFFYGLINETAVLNLFILRVFYVLRFQSVHKLPFLGQNLFGCIKVITGNKKNRNFMLIYVNLT